MRFSLVWINYLVSYFINETQILIRMENMKKLFSVKKKVMSGT